MEFSMLPFIDMIQGLFSLEVRCARIFSSGDVIVLTSLEQDLS